MEEFGAVRADFLRYYGIRNPLVEESKYMMTLIRNLPIDGSFNQRARRHFPDTEPTIVNSPGSSAGVPAWRQHIADMTGEKAPDTIITDDQFMRQIAGSN